MRMTKADWNYIHNFLESEFDEPMLMDSTLIHKLDVMRSWVGKPFVVHHSYATDGHSTDSMHYEGKAVDGHFVGLSAVEQYLLAEQINWGGLGFYPFWINKNTGEKIPGIHVDTRPLEMAEKGARWWRDEHGLYHPINLETIAEIVKPPTQE